MKAIWRVDGMKQTSETAFAPDWLALREPADHAARDGGLLARAAACVARGQAVLDLGSGTGSTIRAFEGAGFSGLDWRLFDNDANLLGLATGRHSGAQGIVGNLGAVDDIALEGIGLVTASALLDLMSEAWVAAFAKRLHAAGLPFYAALNYDGEMSWSPDLPNDREVVAHFNAHQQRDKGTGPALGPASGNAIARIFEGLGYVVHVAHSPWIIGPDQAALHRELLAGIADAVADIDEGLARTWGKARAASVATTRATIGHLDVLALPR